MSPSIPLIAFLLFTHARLQDHACVMSHDSHAVLGNQRGNPRNQQRNQREIRKLVTALEITGKTEISYAETARVGPLSVRKRTRMPRNTRVIWRGGATLRGSVM